MKIQKISVLLKILILFILMNNISSASSAVPFNENRTITVMSRNLYIGTDLGPMINAQNQTALVEAIMTRFAEVKMTDFSTRAQALATEIAAKKPDLIGLQEAILIRGQYPTNFSPIPNETTIELDYLHILLDELAKRGYNYDIVAISPGFGIEVPGPLPDGNCCQNFSLNDREVILARNDTETFDFKLSNIEVRNFTTNLIVPILNHQFTVLYGWASVDVEVQGKSFRFITTHLEPTSSVVQVAQANELLQNQANTTLPIVLVCDCNSNANGTGTNTYGNLITAGFVDAWSQTPPSSPGFTCCQDGNLLNSDSNLSERIDLVLFRGNFNVVESEIVGANTTDRILSPSGLLLWPSDHAGIVAKLSFYLGTPTITGFPQETQISDIPGATRSFKITANQTVDVTWYINGTEVFNQTGTNESFYTNTSAAQGTWNVTAVASNANGSAMQTWDWNVTSVPTAGGSISGMKFNDLNGDGTRDPGEPELANWMIVLTRPDGSNETAITNLDGTYIFSNLSAGNYTVGEVQQGWKQTAPSTETYNVTIISAGENVTGKDFGNFPPPPPPPPPKLGSISGYKINDTNGNGKWDAGEKGISNWTIRLIGITGKGKNAKVIRKETFTNDTGFYKFDNLSAGRYFVIEKLKKGFVPTSSPVKRLKLAQGKNSMNNNFTNRPVHSRDEKNDKRDIDDYEAINRDIDKYKEDTNWD